MTNSQTVIEKRKHPRKSLHPPISVRYGDGTVLTGVCSDISLGGAFVEVTRVEPFGAKVTALLRLPGIEKDVEVESTVRWTTPRGMGLQFGLMGARETHAIVSLLSSE